MGTCRERSQAQARLAALSSDAARCDAEGMKDQMREIKAAADLDFQLDSMAAKRTDAEGFKRVHEKFLVQVTKAEESIKTGLQELERRERERAERNQIDGDLD